MTANRWQVGVMYRGGLLNGVPFFTQPGGPGTQVLPTQANAVPWLEYPVPGLVLQEFNPWWAPGCGHSIKFWELIREYDYSTSQSVCLICCSICTYCQSYVEPYEAILDPIERAIIVA